MRVAFQAPAALFLRPARLGGFCSLTSAAGSSPSPSSPCTIRSPIHSRLGAGVKSLLSPLDARIAALAVPALGALALDPLLSIIDTAFIGRVGVPALGALGVASIVLNISFSVFNFLAIALTPLVARARADSPAAVSRTLVAGLYLSFSLGLFSGCLLFLRASALCQIFGARGETLALATAYLRSRAVAAPFALVGFVANGAFRGLQDTRTPFVVAAVANATNLALDPLLIFRFGMGVTGAALATSASQILAVCLMLRALVRAGMLRVNDLRCRPRLNEIFPLLRAGALLTVRTLSILGTVAVATASAAALGVAPLAAFEVTRQLWVLHAMALDSLAAAAQAIVSGALAKGDAIAARAAADRIIVLAALAGAAVGFVALLAGRALPRLFTSAPNVVDDAVRCIRVAAFCAPLNGAVFALDGVLAAASDYSYMALAIAVAGVTAVTALYAVHALGGGVAYVWVGLNVLMLARAAVLFARYFSKRCPVPALSCPQQDVKHW